MSQPAQPHTTADRIAVVDGLRGLAALSVCWFHFTNGNPTFLPTGWLKASGKFGWAGVDVFFVISGFIVPYAMARRGYILKRDGVRFVAKRIVRLDPPYLVAATLALALWYVSAMIPGFRGEAPQASAAQVVAHVGYLNGVLGLPWLNPVFWSLAIEFQFYLAIAFAYPILAHRSRTIRWSGLIAVWTAAMLGGAPIFMLHYLGLFGCGLACFQYYESFLSTRGFVLVLGAMAVAAGMAENSLTGEVSAATAAVIAIGRGGGVMTRWLGKISYSLYLVHVPVGGRLINLGTRYAHTWPLQLVAIASALAGSLGTAVLLHRFVEKPALRWAGAIPYLHGSARRRLPVSVPSSGL